MTQLALSQFVVQPTWELRGQYYELLEHYPFGVEIVTLALTSTLNDRSLYRNHLRTYRRELSGFAGFRSIHGPFVDITPHSMDASIAEASMYRIQKCLDAAQELSCSVAVFHTGMNPLIRAPGYPAAVAESQSAFWHKMLDRFHSFSVALENMWEPEPTILTSIAQKDSSGRLTACFDCGHANVYSGLPPHEWIQRLSAILRHMHWNDNAGDVDSELPIGQRNIQWDRLTDATILLPRIPMIVIEVGDVSGIHKSLQFLGERGLLEGQPLQH